MDFKVIIYEKKNQVATITLNRPKRLNAWGEGMNEEIRQALQDAEATPEIRALILTGADPAFCAGADATGDAAHRDWPMAFKARQYLQEGRDLVPSALYNSPLVTIAAVNGIAAGGGLTFALACDMRIASDKARFGNIFNRRGLPPQHGTTYLLTRIVGMTRASELLLLPDIIDAHQAERWGLVNKVVPHEQLMPEARALAERITKGAPIALAVTKKAIHRAVDALSLENQTAYEHSVADICWQTEDFREGFRAFLEKREPHFQGR